MEDIGVAIPGGYGIVHPTQRNFQYSLSKSDRVEIWDIDEGKMDMAMEFCKELLGPFKGRFGLTDDPPFVPDTSPGFPFDTVYKDKEHAAKGNSEYLHWYLSAGNGDRPIPIYKVTPKEEYMTEAEIREGKIRLFRNPPLDFLLLQTKYFLEMDTELSQLLRVIPISLGFVKEHGGWNKFIEELMEFPWFQRHDVRFWDKAFARRLIELVFILRRFMYRDDVVINETDWNFLLDGYTYSYELLPNGSVICTSVGSKSGNFDTSTSNSLGHLILMVYHLAQQVNTLAELRELWSHFRFNLYSDDTQNSTDMPAVLSEPSLKRTFVQVGMDVKDFCLSRSPLSVEFLGAKNIRYANAWVPKYNEDRMLYALAELAGCYSDEIRAQRILGIAKNLAFSDYCQHVCDYALKLRKEGRWPTTVPLPSVYSSRNLYLTFETEVGGSKNNVHEAMQHNQQSKRTKSKKAQPNVAPAPTKPRSTPHPDHVVHVAERPQFRENRYLRSLIDPEKGRSIRYPDTLPKKTGVTQGLVNHQMFVFGKEGLENPGFFLNVVRPSMIDPILEYRVEETPDTRILSAISDQTETTGLLPLLEDTTSPSSGLNTMFLIPGREENVVAPFLFVDQGTEAVPMFQSTRGDGVFYGIPFNNALTTSCKVSVVTSDYYTSSTTIPNLQMRLVTKGDAGAWVSMNSVANSNMGFFTFPKSAFDGVLGGAANVLPGVGFRIRCLGLHVALTSIIIDIGFSAGLQNRMSPIKMPGEATYAETIDQYRVVSASAWVEYEGSDLYNGGQIAAVMYRGGRSPMHNGLYQYDTVAECPGSYQGALKLGSYSYWLPSNDNDMLMRNLSTDIWNHPFIVNAGFVSANPDGNILTNSLRLRVPINYEFISTSQLYAYAHTNPDPESVRVATMALRDYPTSMENPDHVATIRRIMGEVGKAARATALFILKNKEWILPALTTLATAI